MLVHSDNLNFQIISVFRGKQKGGFISVDARPYAALSLRISGRGIFNIGDQRIVSDSGDIFYIPANTAYKVEYSENEIIVIHMSNCNYPSAEVITVENFLSVKQLFKDILSAWEDKRSPHYIKSLIYLLLDALISEKKDVKECAAYNRCIKIINERFSDSEFNIEDLCRECFVSRSSIQRSFKLYQGISPMQYVTRLRLEKALRILATERKSISDVAYECGFADEKYFSRVFKKSYGFSPRDARKNLNV